ncbi:MAG: prolyl oligopeptidase family serine peptidase, partial [Acidimicrobiia bacterium]|nr:prolyl oligopeptidase family serine peptidase [Acidimicrobiia bacterium]
MTTVAPFGTWDSPISAADTVSGLVAFAELAADGDRLYWLEMRPSEGGRQVLVHRTASGEIVDLTPPPAHPRTLVHEYGGGALTVGHGDVVYSEFSDQRLYRLGPDGPSAVTPEPPRPRSVRYADGRILPDGRMVCVRETHPEDGEATNELVIVTLDTGAIDVIASGRDFYSSPRPNVDGSELAWVEWDHPNMPWDGTELRPAALGPDGLGTATLVAGGDAESVMDPQWDPESRLVFISDRTGYWNLYRHDEDVAVPLLGRDFDHASPPWTFGRNSYGFLSGGRIVTGAWEDGVHRLGVLGADGAYSPLPDDLAEHARITTDGQSTVWFVALGATTPMSIVELNVDTGERTVVRGNAEAAPVAYHSEPEIVTFPTGDDDIAHGVYYPPTNPDFSAPDGELPPLIVKVHGGPTSHVFPRLTDQYLFWTSRGFGIVDVNYRGSTGYGREFRGKLNLNWGVVDVEDCLAAA